jgi:hypothetical protein
MSATYTALRDARENNAPEMRLEVIQDLLRAPQFLPDIERVR